MGTAFVAIRGGRRKRGLIVVGLVLFILLGHGSSWYVVVFVHVIGRACALSFAFIVVCIWCHLRALSFVRARCHCCSLSCTLVVMCARCRAHLVSSACIVVRICCCCMQL